MRLLSIFTALSLLILSTTAQAATQRVSFTGTGVTGSPNTFAGAQVSFSMLIDDLTGTVSRVTVGIVDVRTSGVLNYRAQDVDASGALTRSPFAPNPLTGWSINVSGAPSYGSDLTGTNLAGLALEDMSLNAISIITANGATPTFSIPDLLDSLNTESGSTGPGRIGLTFARPDGFGGLRTATAGSYAITLDSVSVTTAPIPLPASALLLLGGLAALRGMRKRTQA